MDAKDKKLQRSSTLSSTILDYYYKFGQNRDLEKYLLHRRSRSSSEGSLNLAVGGNSPTKGNVVQSSTVADSAKSTEEAAAAAAARDTKTAKPTGKEIKVKTKSSIDGAKKKYSFNCESNIAISLPFAEPVVLPEIPPPDTMAESSQTDFDEATKDSSIRSGKEDVAKSPENSTKSHKRLEWDSLGDVGYNKSLSGSGKTDVAVSSLERNVLQNFFSNRGINISFTEDGKKTSLPDIPESPNRKSSKPKERWRKTLESVKKKYDKQLFSDSTSSKVAALRFDELSLNRHSTPKIDRTETGVQTSILEKTRLEKGMQTSVKQVYRPEKALQTSTIQTECKEIQVDFTNESSSGAVDGTTRSSFEFIPGQQPSEKENLSPNTNNSSLQSSQQCYNKSSKRSEVDLPSSSAASTASESNNELELGIKLLCSLIDSKNLTEARKKSLARKIVSRIVNRNVSTNSSTSRAGSSKKLLTSNSGRSSSNRAREINISGLKALSSGGSSTMDKSTLQKRRVRNVSTQSENTVERVKSSSNEYAKSSSSSLKTAVRRECEPESEHNSSSEVQTVTDSNPTMRTWLDPLTKSELNYDKKKKSQAASVVLVEKKPTGDFVPAENRRDKQLVSTARRRSSVPDRELAPQVVVIDPGAGGDFVPSGPRRPSQIVDFITNERKSHLNWIENEIEHLENLKQLLLSNSKDKSFESIQPACRTEVVMTAFAHRTTHDNLYDKVASSSEASSTDQSLPSHYRETEVFSEKEIVNIGERYRRTEARHEDEVLYDTVATKKGSETEPVRRKVKTTSLEIKEEKRFPKKNYLSDDEGAKNRSKLETPRTGADESITTFARQRKEQFLKNYKIPQQPTTDYDDPAETDHYSEPCEPTAAKTKPAKCDVYTTATSSDFFVSSESISLPGGSSSTTTTTHQYDSRIGIGIQTTDSILQTRPIFGPQHGCGCKNQCGCHCPRPTIRTYRCGRNKQTQAKPESLAYVITFENAKDKDPSGSDSSGSLTLRDYLVKRRPEFTQHSDQRRDVLKKLHNLREERDQNIREIIENTSVNSIPRKLKQLPPPPTKHTRVFATKEMKAMTRKKYSQLPEVVERVEKLKIEKRKKSNKIMAEVFNKRIQRRVHKGKLSLEHSMTVI